MTESPDGHALEEGRNCWRIERATQAATIVDADDYFRAARQAMMAAAERIMLIGWDFDARIRFDRVDEDDRGPETLGDFLLWLVDRTPELQVYLLRWDIGAVKTLLRGGTTIAALVRWARHPRIHVKLDGAHPVGASHHQKIVVVDDCMAFCGGIDMTINRWDTRDHCHAWDRRVGPDGEPYGPWHDATTALAGPVATALGGLGRSRWRTAGGGALEPVFRRSDCWPLSIEPQFRDVDVAIARTQPLHGENQPAHEIEALYLDLIARAKRHIYAESQYFASRKIAEAIARRLAEPDGPEIVLVNPEQADGWLEQQAMDTARARLYEALRQRDPHGRFRIYLPYTSGGDPIYVHAKVMVVDDRVLRVGSSNMNNRSLRLDTECDVAIDADRNGDAICPAIRSIRTSLIGEHLDVAPETVDAIHAETGSLIATIERLRGPGRSLRPYEVPDLNDIQAFLADNEVLDAEGPDEMFEPLTKRSLFRRLRKPKG